MRVHGLPVPAQEGRVLRGPVEIALCPGDPRGVMRRGTDVRAGEDADLGSADGKGGHGPCHVL